MGNVPIHGKWGRKGPSVGREKKEHREKSQTLSMAEKGIWEKEKHIITSLGKMILSTCKEHILDFSNISALT